MLIYPRYIVIRITPFAKVKVVCWGRIHFFLFYQNLYNFFG